MQSKDLCITYELLYMCV